MLPRCSLVFVFLLWRLVDFTSSSSSSLVPPHPRSLVSLHRPSSSSVLRSQPCILLPLRYRLLSFVFVLSASSHSCWSPPSPVFSVLSIFSFCRLSCRPFTSSLSCSLLSPSSLRRLRSSPPSSLSSRLPPPPLWFFLLSSFLRRSRCPYCRAWSLTTATPRRCGPSDHEVREIGRDLPT